MKSFSGMSWKMSSVPERLIQKNQQDYNISYLLSKIFLQRKYSDDEIYYSLNKKKVLNIEYKNNDLIKAADLLKKCINKWNFLSSSLLFLLSICLLEADMQILLKNNHRDCFPASQNLKW